MKKNDKTIKIIIALIITLVIFFILLFLIQLNSIKTDIVDISEDTEQEEFPQRIKTGNLSYEMQDNDVFDIYDETNILITTVYSRDELEYYIENPDYRPTSSYKDDEEPNLEENSLR